VPPQKATALPSWPKVLSTVLSGALPTMLAPASAVQEPFCGGSNIEASTDVEQFKTPWTRCSRP